VAVGFQAVLTWQWPQRSSLRCPESGRRFSTCGASGWRRFAGYVILTRAILAWW